MFNSLLVEQYYITRCIAHPLGCDHAAVLYCAACSGPTCGFIYKSDGHTLMCPVLNEWCITLQIIGRLFKVRCLQSKPGRWVDRHLGLDGFARGIAALLWFSAMPLLCVHRRWIQSLTSQENCRGLYGDPRYSDNRTVVFMLFRVSRLYAIAAYTWGYGDALMCIY